MLGFLTVDFPGGLQDPASQSPQLKMPAQIGLRKVNMEEGRAGPWYACTCTAYFTF